MWGSGCIALLVRNVGNGWRLASRPGYFSPKKKPLYPLNRVGPTAGLDILREKVLAIFMDRATILQLISPWVSHSTDHAIPVPDIVVLCLNRVTMAITLFSEFLTSIYARTHDPYGISGSIGMLDDVPQ